MSDNLSDQIKERKPYSVKIGLPDLWVIQSIIKYNTFMFNPNTHQVFFPATPVPYPSGIVDYHTSWKLRAKTNSLILRYVQEEITKELLDLPLDYDECWYLDTQLNAESYGNAKLLLVQVFQVIWEYEHGLSLKTDVMNQTDEGPDSLGRTFIEHVSEQNQGSGNGFSIDRPDTDDQATSEV